ncbi:glycosyltransferase [Streptococcus entericus]|uniref:glycosyltransferase n=1 Tax=Streptococcus entericus TaxID=155680 RepID=UPI00036B02DF|nr:glycosyltransferase [Streptococcus entericus]
MIFVTVGTHEQQFNRLIEEIDGLVAEGDITEDVFIQTGYSTYQPKYCRWQSMLGHNEMNDCIERADLVITHGGPSTFMSVLSKGKRLIVVPRLKKYDEHVNDHQMEFVSHILERMNYNFEFISDCSDLSLAIKQSMTGTKRIETNNMRFNSLLEAVVETLF